MAIAEGKIAEGDDRGRNYNMLDASRITESIITDFADHIIIRDGLQRLRVIKRVLPDGKKRLGHDKRCELASVGKCKIADEFDLLREGHLRHLIQSAEAVSADTGDPVVDHKRGDIRRVRIPAGKLVGGEIRQVAETAHREDAVHDLPAKGVADHAVRGIALIKREAVKGDVAAVRTGSFCMTGAGGRRGDDNGLIRMRDRFTDGKRMRVVVFHKAAIFTGIIVLSGKRAGRRGAEGCLLNGFIRIGMIAVEPLFGEIDHGGTVRAEHS